MFELFGDLGSLLLSLLINITDILRSKIILTHEKLSEVLEVHERTQKWALKNLISFSYSFYHS